MKPWTLFTLFQGGLVVALAVLLLGCGDAKTTTVATTTTATGTQIPALASV